MFLNVDLADKIQLSKDRKPEVKPEIPINDEYVFDAMNAQDDETKAKEPESEQKVFAEALFFKPKEFDDSKDREK